MRARAEFNRYDALVALVVLASALALLWQQGRGAAAQELTLTVASDGEVVMSAPLASLEGEHRYESGGYTLTVSVEEGGVRVTQSDCPNGDCVRSGRISRAGQSIVCLPARLSVTLSADGAPYDLIVG